MTQWTTELLDTFAAAEADGVEDEYLRLVGALWKDGALTESAPAAVPSVVTKLGEVGEDRVGRLLILLGLLIEAEAPVEGAVYTAARAGLDRYLALLDGRADGEPLTLALVYLLSHFPDDRSRILAAVAGLDLGPDDRSRLDRGLQRLNPADPAGVSLGRTWPSPAEWTTMTEADHAFDQSWISKLTPEQLAKRWYDDTVMVLTYSGGKAHWALRHGRPTVVGDTSVHRDARERPDAGDIDAEAFARHAGILRCPDCGGGLTFGGTEIHCARCGTEHPVRLGVLDLLPDGESMFGGADDAMAKAASMKTVGHFYETVARPGFLRLVGSNWGGEVTPADEDRYLTERLGRVDGTVLDLGAGAGRWTAVIADAVGPERVIALDPNLAMLSWLRRRSPEVACVQASALALPFADDSLAAVNCWNALQAMPDARAAIGEVARCLRPGGIMTVMTYRLSPDPVYRYFQTTSSWPGHPDGLDLYTEEQIRSWLAEAGLTVREAATPGAMLMLTAERP
ncbi:class I SAM-dependent methyltransferase [Actinomadura sp. DC4]|uniref:class I SAM-dependent methyltransferase n=1 Tax=Actinomadura sp. DC4 TaxID=3055069 RepID=UPI0025AFF730|nr:class I SAM-dependent methyltransferase [Actinomadura sp. DC4]MDN3354690.1 class I SAM-dependent methyltransferase [Actinomadura sp. DC4]